MSLRTRTSAVIDNLLTVVATAGVVSTALLSPQTAEILSKPLAKHYRRRERQRELRRLIHYMKRQQLIDIQEISDGRIQITVTQKGHKRIREVSFDHMQIRRPVRWDKKWRIVIFDIPEKYRRARDAMRLKLKELGFKQIQISVWAHPFPCLDEVAVVRDHYGVSRYVTLLEAEEIEAHNALVKKFKNILDPLL